MDAKKKTFFPHILLFCSLSPFLFTLFKYVELSAYIAILSTDNIRLSEFSLNLLREKRKFLWNFAKIFVKILSRNSQYLFEIFGFSFKILFFSHEYNLLDAQWKNFNFIKLKLNGNFWKVKHFRENEVKSFVKKA